MLAKVCDMKKEYIVNVVMTVDVSQLIWAENEEAAKNLVYDGITDKLFDTIHHEFLSITPETIVAKQAD